MLYYGKVSKTSNLCICKFLDSYLMWTVSRSAHSSNLKLMKTPEPMKFGLIKKSRI